MRNSGLYYDSAFLTKEDSLRLQSWLSSLHPIWEQRYSKNRPPPPGESQRSLLRPVYWLGNWQFACLDYYRPPKGVLHRCVKAEPYPPVLERLVNKMEKITRQVFRSKDIPVGWKLNTCLINFYGSHEKDGKWVDVARVGEHKDFEPGPVASLSLGERAIFQFVKSQGRGRPSQVVFQQWLDDGSLQIFGGERYKNHLFHRVQRVEKKKGCYFPLHINTFKTRRINFTFRFVPEKHILPFRDFPAVLKEDLSPYLKELAKTSSFFASELKNN
ncbi:MAG: alpha-ketoglutarate-dependent dioxygenase AlkB [Proteobacteria bacterium]|nr:alpha-ketoglutarate-dependent dioxygenase AlkB [Pseudomonadota bacterium]NDG26196.1 alpha-ketoglutarate-dependent dioxygenase AlkB [Pseudomonadota bacterium]